MVTDIFDRKISRRNTDSIKWNRYPEDVLPLWVADMDFPTLPEIIEAIKGRLDHPFFGYATESPELAETICIWVKKKHNWDVLPEQIVFMPGVVTGINWVAQGLLDSNDSLIFQTPIYPPFFKVAANSNTNEIQSPLIQGSRQYGIDLDGFAGKIKKDTRMFILCNPHNPAGRVFTRNELEQIGEICERKGLWICSDEIHCDLVYPEYHHIPIASLSEELEKRTITLMAPSKTFNIPGLNFSFAIVPDKDLRKRLNLSRRGIMGHPSLLASVAAMAAYTHGESWLEKLIQYLMDNRDFVIRFIQSHIPEIRIFPPEGTYLVWMDCRELDLKPDPHHFFLQKAKVALSDGRLFGKHSEGFIRLNFACSRAILENALVHMADAVKKYRKK